ncbi:MAG: beta-phosphoglucomutase [Cyanobacteria bacterium RYN_339]|nr:beta-phosphoglucomutase [Cyanobacteria bacterium RYN_339]
MPGIVNPCYSWAMFEAVLFDMDGVVVDNMPLHRDVWTTFARERGLDPTEAQIRAMDGRRASDILKALLGESLTPDEILELAALREDIYRKRLETETLRAVPGIEAFLRSLRDKGTGAVLATSATPGNAEIVLDRLDLGWAFDALVTAADVTRGKPDPEVYHTAASRVGTYATCCLVIEDALPGLAAGMAAGAMCLGMATSEDEPALRGAGATWVAKDFLALPADLLDMV